MINRLPVLQDYPLLSLKYKAERVYTFQKKCISKLSDTCPFFVIICYYMPFFGSFYPLTSVNLTDLHVINIQKYN